MVNTTIFKIIENRLEKFLIYKNDFRLSGENYDLILFIPNDSYLEPNYTLLVSAKRLNALSQRDILMELLSNFQNNLQPNLYNSISRVNIINSNDSFVKNLKFMFPIKNRLVEINDIAIGGVNVERAIFVKPLILDKLVEGKILGIEIRSNDEIKVVKALVVKINHAYDVTYLTDIGIREIAINLNDLRADYNSLIKKYSEEYLVENKMIGKVNYDDILRVSDFL
ncbi:hypothetical protein ACX0HA_05170 [Flavobacterium hauense]